MGYISMVIASMLTVIILLGLASLVAGLTMLIFNKITGKKKISLKVFGILLTIIGFIFFVIPLIVYTGNDISKKAQMREELKEFPIVIKGDFETDRAFNFNGTDYVYADFLITKKDFDESEKEFACLREDVTYIGFYRISNEMNLPFLVSGNGRIYIPEDEEENIRNHYISEMELENNFDKDVFMRIYERYSQTEDFEIEAEAVGETVYVYAVSVDGLFSQTISLAEADGHIVLTHRWNGGMMSGHMLSFEDEAYVRNALFN